jgi:hypothetical protein
MCDIPIRLGQRFLGRVEEWYCVSITGADLIWSDAYKRTILFVKIALGNLNIADERPVHY